MFWIKNKFINIPLKRLMINQLCKVYILFSRYDSIISRQDIVNASWTISVVLVKPGP